MASVTAAQVVSRSLSRMVRSSLAQRMVIAISLVEDGDERAGVGQDYPSR